MIAKPARVALFYAPAEDDPLWQAGCAWLGRGATARHPHVSNLTTDAAGYGFHATLKPPMRLVPGARWQDVVACVEALAQGVAPFDLPALEVSNIHGFLALREATPCPALQALADLCVAGADHLRAPPDAAELARRRRHGLPPAQEAMLMRWGYPYVFATWFFHMTLTRRLTEAEHAAIRPSAEAHFSAVLQGPRRVADIGLFVQDAGGPFHLAHRIPLCG